MLTVFRFTVRNNRDTYLYARLGKTYVAQVLPHFQLGQTKLALCETGINEMVRTLQESVRQQVVAADADLYHHAMVHALVPTSPLPVRVLVFEGFRDKDEATEYIDTLIANNDYFGLDESTRYYKTQYIQNPQ